MVLSARRRVARVRKLSEGSQSRQERDHTNWEWGGLASEIWTAGGVRTQDDSLSLPPVTATAPDLRRVCMRPEDQATERRPMLTSAESHEGTSPHARPPRIFVHRVRLDMYNDDPLWQRGPHTRTSQVTKVTHTQTLLHLYDKSANLLFVNTRPNQCRTLTNHRTRQRDGSSKEFGPGAKRETHCGHCRSSQTSHGPATVSSTPCRAQSAPRRAA